MSKDKNEDQSLDWYFEKTLAHLVRQTSIDRSNARLKYLEGKILTFIDALFGNEVQAKAAKDVIRDSIEGYRLDMFTDSSNLAESVAIIVGDQKEDSKGLMISFSDKLDYRYSREKA